MKKNYFDDSFDVTRIGILQKMPISWIELFILAIS